MSHLEQAVFDREYFGLVSSAVAVSDVHDAVEQAKTQDVRVEYSSLSKFQRFAKVLQIMDDEKAGVPRTAYHGIVELRPHGDHFLFLTPSLDRLRREFGVEQ